MTKQAFILIGVPGSGKSTWLAKNTVNGAGIFSLDSCRLAFANTDNYGVAFQNAVDNPQGFNKFVDETWKETLKNFDTIYVDNVNATRKSRARWIADSKANGFEVHAAQFVVPLEVAIARQSTRGDKFVPADVITRMYYSIQEVLVPSECTSVVHIKSF